MDTCFWIFQLVLTSWTCICQESGNYHYKDDLFNTVRKIIQNRSRESPNLPCCFLSWNSSSSSSPSSLSLNLKTFYSLSWPMTNNDQWPMTTNFPLEIFPPGGIWWWRLRRWLEGSASENNNEERENKNCFMKSCKMFPSLKHHINWLTFNLCNIKLLGYNCDKKINI